MVSGYQPRRSAQPLTESEVHSTGSPRRRPGKVLKVNIHGVPAMQRTINYSNAPELDPRDPEPNHGRHGAAPAAYREALIFPSRSHHSERDCGCAAHVHTSGSDSQAYDRPTELHPPRDTPCYFLEGKLSPMQCSRCTRSPHGLATVAERHYRRSCTEEVASSHTYLERPRRIKARPTGLRGESFLQLLAAAAATAVRKLA